MVLALLVLLPAVLGAAAFLVRRVRAALGILLSASAVHLLGVLRLWTAQGRDAVAASPEALLSLDATGLLFLTITSVLFLAASLYSVPYLLEGTHDAQAGPRRFVPCLLWFLSAMTLVAATQNLAVMWAAVEGTTLASAPLVYFYRRRGALEATWKYLLLCSVGIALALLGTFFLGIAASGVAGRESGLTLASMLAAAPHMSRPWLQAAFVLALVGYGTKMGLAPLHSWLPDTHSQAPSPVSALLSGALLNCAFLAILRFYQVCLASGDSAFARTLLLLFGFVSIAIACAFLVGQADYKRLFAYSSIENMGILAVGVGLGGAASYGAMLHAVNHSLCKAGLFFLAGNLLRHYGTTAARDVKGILGRLPATGVLLAALLLAIGGAPPFGPFWSEFLIFQSALRAGQTGLAILFVALLAVAFLGMAGVVFPMLQGSRLPLPARGGPGGLPPLTSAGRGEARPEPLLSIFTPAVLAFGVLLLGVAIPPALSAALARAASLLGS